MRQITYLILTVVFFLLASCSDKFANGAYLASHHDYALTISAGSLQSIPAEGGAINSRIEATNAVSWEITGLPDWLSTSTQKGTGSQDISFKAESNTSLTSSRTQIFNIVTSNSDWALTIPVSATQQKMKKSLTVSPSDNASLTFAASGGTKSIAVTSNVAWKAECSDKFVQLSQTSASSDANVIITINPYNAIDVTQNRTATIYFKDATDGEVLQVVTVTQTPLQTSITTENIDVQFDQKVNTKNFTLGTVGGTYSVLSNASWLGISKNTTTGQIDVTLSAEANNNDEERSTTAYVSLDASKSIRYMFNVKQSGNQIEVSPSSLSFSPTGGTESIQISTTSDWAFSNDNDWFTVARDGNACKITVKENNTLSSRTGACHFNRINDSGNQIGKSVSVNVSQEGRHITPDTEMLQFGPDESSKQLTIDCDASWTLSTTDSWISLSSVSGNGNASVKVSVQKNELQTSRTGTILLKCLDKTISISVIQSTAYLNTTSTAIAFDAKGGTSTLSLTSNTSWAASSDESWLTISPQSGNGDGTITLSTTNNDTSFSRSAVISITSLAGTIKINVIQSAAQLELSKNSINFDSKGGQSESIIVKAEGDYTVTTTASWVTVSEDNNTFIVNVTENESEARTAIITVTLKNYPVSQNIVVSQKSCDNPVVDLGLPSGTLWAVHNLGATSPEESGGYYAWGETSTKSSYTVSTFHGKSGNTESISGTAYDAATKKLGDKWQMPTATQAWELFNNCTWTYSTLNGVKGYKVVGKNGIYIFLPACGYYQDTNFTPSNTNGDGYFWTGSGAGYGSSASTIDFSDYGTKGVGTRPVQSGVPIRPVKVK